MIDTLTNDYIVREAKVLSTDDAYNGNRIKVRLGGIDGTTSDADLPYCSPLMPKLVHVHPKKDEAVLIFLEKAGSGKSNRFYIGPILSQPEYYYKELADTTAYSLLNDRKVAPDQAPTADPDNTGTLPDAEDIAIMGRLNTDIVLKDNELRVRCGIKQDPNGPKKNRLHFNKIDPGYIQMKYKKLTLKNGEEVNSIINVVADRINLISHDAKKRLTVIDKDNPDQLISDKCQLDIQANAHPLVYGDELINWLKQLVEFIKNHDHKWANKPPTLTTPDINILNQDLDSMLAKSIRIN